MELDNARLNALEELVNELIKAAPEERLIQSYMRDAGLKDPGDQVARIQMILKELQFENPTAEIEE